MITTWPFFNLAASNPRLSRRTGRLRPSSLPAATAWLALWTALTAGANMDGPQATAAEPAPLRPGQRFVIEFPHLRPDRRGETAKMGVRIPDNYNPRQLHPLFVWLGGGAGTSHYGPGYRIADPSQFVLVGLPYPQGANDRHQGTMVGDFRSIWGYHKTMLNALAQRVPNISPHNISIGGFSNGAHCIDGYLKMREPAEAFRAFILVEGGGYRSRDYDSAVRGKRALVMWGEQSTHRSTGRQLARRLQRAGMAASGVEMQGAKHAFPVDYQQYASEWLLPDRISDAELKGN